MIEKMAEIILSENREYVGNDIAEKAIEELKKQIDKQEKTESEGGKLENEKEQEKTTRGRKRKSTN